MPSRRIPVKLSRFFIHCLPLILMLSAKVTHGSVCRNVIDVVIVVDTTSSESASSFEEVKGAVKGIVSGFTIGQSITRLALLSLSQQVRVVVNLKQVNSLSDFNAAVDSLTFSTGISDLAEGMQVARESVFDTTRAQKTPKVLILVKDRRSAGFAVAAATLSQITSKAAAVKALGAAVHAVGVGGLWNREELVALFGTEYLLFKNKNKALESVKSLNNCEAICPKTGTSSQKTGMCHNGMRHVITTKINLGVDSTGQSVCKSETQREFQTCHPNQQCTKMERNVSPCQSNGKAFIESIWQTFSAKSQSCTTTKSVQTVACADRDSCPTQKADVFFILDKSGSIDDRFHLLKQATVTIINALTVGPNNVRVGVLTYSTKVEMQFNLGSHTDRQSTIQGVDAISTVTDGKTYTDLALSRVRDEFRNTGRADVAKFVFVITDGSSSDTQKTLEENLRIKNDGVTLFAIGVGNADISELQILAAPEVDKNMVIIRDFNQLADWATGFSKRMCLELSDPNPKLCDDNVSMQTISDCMYGKQQISRTEYKYNAAAKCIKSMQITETKTCRQEKCTDPIDGSEYLVGHKWTTLCHELECKPSSSGKPQLQKKSKCFAADGTCKDVGSQPFKCRDEKDAEVDNCQCGNVGGIVTTRIETR